MLRVNVKWSSYWIFDGRFFPGLVRAFSLVIIDRLKRLVGVQIFRGFVFFSQCGIDVGF